MHNIQFYIASCFNNYFMKIESIFKKGTPKIFDLFVWKKVFILFTNIFLERQANTKKNLTFYLKYAIQAIQLKKARKNIA